MINETYKSMLSGKSVIRELNEYANDITRHPHLKPEDMFDYSLGNPSVPVPGAFNARIKALLDSGDPMLVHGYSPSLGIPAAREKIAASLNRRFGMRYTMDDIFMTSGAAGALAHAFRLVTQPGDEILTFAPFFPEYRPYTAGAGLTLRVVPADTQTFQINFDAFERMLTPAVQAVLINTPNNPSGAVYSAETLRRMAALLLQKEKAFGHDIWLISDEPYREIAFDGREVPYASRFYPRTISCYSFSKSLSDSRRAHRLCGREPGKRRFRACWSTCAARFRAASAITARPRSSSLAAADCCDLTSDLSVYETNMNLLYDALTALGFDVVRPGGTFYLFPKALESDAAAFSRKALPYGLILVPSDSFGLPGYFRIAFCTDTEKVVRSIDAFKAFVKAEY